jgi:large subunit ribosomal protein L22
MRGYTYQGDARTSVARARGVEFHISPKKAYEVLNAIRGKSLDAARELLEGVVALERAVPFRRYNQETAHKKGIGPGRYPQKVARSVLQVLANAEANAEYEGLDTDQLYIYVAASSRGQIVRANMPRAHGRATAWNEQTTNIEIVLRERESS